MGLAMRNLNIKREERRFNKALEHRWIATDGVFRIRTPWVVCGYFEDPTEAKFSARHELRRLHEGVETQFWYECDA